MNYKIKAYEKIRIETFGDDDSKKIITSLDQINPALISMFSNSSIWKGKIDPKYIEPLSEILKNTETYSDMVKAVIGSQQPPKDYMAPVALVKGLLGNEKKFFNYLKGVTSNKETLYQHKLMALKEGFEGRSINYPTRKITYKLLEIANEGLVKEGEDKNYIQVLKNRFELNQSMSEILNRKLGNSRDLKYVIDKVTYK